MLLAIETSSRAGSVALARLDGQIVDARPLASPRDHAQGLAPTVRAMCPEGFDDVEAYAISLGPGSFTGLRIGVAFLKGLAMVHPRPTWGVSSLEVLAGGAGAGGRVLAVIDARRGNVFAGLYGADLSPDPSLPDGMYPAAEIEARFGRVADLTWVGDGVSLVSFEGRAAPTERAVPSARVLAARALAARARGAGRDAAEIAPVYHQLSAAEEAAGVCAVPEGRGPA